MHKHGGRREGRSVQVGDCRSNRLLLVVRQRVGMVDLVKGHLGAVQNYATILNISV